MNPNDWQGASYYYSAAGTNTVTQVSAGPVTLYSIDVTATGAAGYLQLYDSASADAGAGTPDVVIPCLGTSVRHVDFGPHGAEFKGGLSHLWGTAATGTAVHGVNASITITYKTKSA